MRRKTKAEPKQKERSSGKERETKGNSRNRKDAQGTKGEQRKQKGERIRKW